MDLYTKIAGTVLILFSAVFFGKSMEWKTQKRLTLFWDMYYVLQILEKDMLSYHSSLDEAMEKSSAMCSSDIKRLFYYVADQIGNPEYSSVSELWTVAAAKNIEKALLRQDEYEQLIRCGEVLCTTELSIHRTLLHKYENIFFQMWEKEKAEQEKKGHLYRDLSLGCGIMFVILFW